MKRILLIPITVLLIICSIPVYADETDSMEINEDDMFSDDMVIDEDYPGNGESDNDIDEEDPFGDDMVEEFNKEELDSGLENLLLKNDKMELGGRFKFSLTPSWTWTQKDLSPDYIIENITEADIVSLTTTLQTTLFFDARPDENFRVFGKTEINGPLETRENWTFEDMIRIRELFADFNWKDTLFIRVGKQTIKWGVGYFFSPADVLNLTPIDPEEPELDREGPLSIKAHIPIDIHNLYLYLMANNARYPEEIGIAGKFEFVIGNLETGIGVFYKDDNPLNGVLLLSYPMTNSLDLFAEAVLSYGSDRFFLEKTEVSVENPDGVMIASRDDELFFNGTIGFTFSLNQIDSEWETVLLSGQYYFNGEGNGNSSFLKDQMNLYVHYVPDDPIEKTISEFMNYSMGLGMHYAAASLMWNEIFESDFSTSLFWIGNLTDGSGQITPSITWKIMDYAKAGLSFPIFYGGDFKEFSFMGQSFGIRLDFSLGSGSF